ncbi:Fc.00g047070.m01.CDS01 [Cosmosporella sp. VM-42]
MVSPDDQRNKIPAADPKRERGKLAQREYRKRHANKFQSLKEENQRLRDAINDINRVASRCGNLQQELEDVIAEARRVAGLEEKDSSMQDVSTSNAPTSAEASPSVQEPQTPSGESSSTSLILATNTNNNGDGGSSVYHAGRFSPPLGQSLWLDTDRVVRIFDAPSDVAPYLGDGMFTLAGCLYWASVKYTLSLWQEVNDRKLINSPEQHRLDRLFNHSRHLSDRGFLVSLAAVRMEYRRNGYIDLHNSSIRLWKDDSVPGLSVRVENEYTQRGEALDWWKSPKEVESYVKKHMEPNEFAELQAVIEGRGSKAVTARLAPLIETLAKNFVCFGDGPRWNALHVSMVVGAWITNEE